MSWRKIPDGQEQEWAALFEWLKEQALVTSTDLRAAKLDSLAREPQGIATVGGQRVDTRPEPQKLADLLKKKGVLDAWGWAQLQSLGEQPLKTPAALRRVLMEMRDRPQRQS